VCGGKTLKKKVLEGCGHKAEGQPWSEGKLQWRFEWPAQWAIFETIFEPFGKDHYEGPWKSGQVIAREIYGIEPPIPMLYEFFLVNGEKMSASKGNVYTVQDMMKVIEPEPFKYFYTKRPEAQREMDLAHLSIMADEYDSAERVYFGVEEARTEAKDENIKRMYQLVTEKTPLKLPQRVPYSFASQLIQLVDEDEAIKKLEELGHLKTPSKEEVEDARKRLRLAKHWIAHYAAPEFKIALSPKEQIQEAYVLLPENAKRVLHEFADYYEAHYGSQEEQMNAIKRLCTSHKVELQEFFKSAYTVLLGRARGPKFVTLINVMDKHAVANRLRGTG
ncbi:MAG TPA: lysine--tRNA ligase, partial [Candidatus Norongarragalinales archaeon]|nr:lysine--tRNA ligase [Candidatus Norongarragalinales archaeon]